MMRSENQFSMTAALAETRVLTFALDGGDSGRSQPPPSQERGMENSDQPQSTQTRTSGDGVRGGWLSVRVELRYNRISAGTTVTDED